MALIAELPHHVIFRVLSEKIHITNLMPFLKDVNTKNTNEILEWVLAEEDWRLWQVQNSFFVLWVGSVYLVIFFCWVGPVPYLEFFWAEKNTLQTAKMESQALYMYRLYINNV